MVRGLKPNLTGASYFLLAGTIGKRYIQVTKITKSHSSRILLCDTHKLETALCSPWLNQGRYFTLVQEHTDLILSGGNIK